MPTNIAEILERKHQAQAQASADTLVLLIYLIVGLCMSILQLAVPSFAEALVLIGEF